MAKVGKRWPMRLSWVLFALSACLPHVGPPVDAGAEMTDAGELDAGVLDCTNGQRDGSESDVDCGGPCTPCALTAHCNGPTDCASRVCRASVCVAPASQCRVDFSGCTSFVDLTMDPSPTIRFPAGGNRYSPDCARIRSNQTILFSGDFGNHPLAQACGPVGNVLVNRSGQSRTFSLSEGLGLYGYYCTAHGSSSGQGMAGAIEVVP